MAQHYAFASLQEQLQPVIRCIDNSPYFTGRNCFLLTSVGIRASRLWFEWLELPFCVHSVCVTIVHHTLRQHRCSNPASRRSSPKRVIPSASALFFYVEITMAEDITKCFMTQSILKYSMQSDQPETRTRDSSSSTSQAQNHIVEKQTYYYSKFELFEEEQLSTAYSQYRVFLEKLRMQLGEDWRAEANLLVKDSQFGSGSKCIFQASLQTWLEIARLKRLKQIKQQDPNINYQNLYYQLFLTKLKTRLTPISKYDANGLPTLAMGFFFSANQIWQAQIVHPPPPTVFSFLGQSMQSITQQFRPLMRVKQRLETFFRKRVKTEEESTLHRANFSRFRASLEDEREMEREMKGMSLAEQKEEQQQRVVFQKIPEVNPINQNLLQSAYKYIQTLIGSKDKWQVARGFVTNILQINYNKIAQALKGQQKPSQQISVRVLKPATDFYHNLMVVWLLFRGSDYRIKFKEYLERVKASLGAAWREHYVQPTKLFFSSLNVQWTKLTSETETLHREDDEIIEMFVERVKENMKTEWEEQIVKKEGDFSAKMMGAS